MQLISWVLLVSAVMSALAAQGAEPPRLIPRIILPEEPVPSSFWLGAPKIAVVKIRSADWLGSEIEVTPPQKLVVRLVRITAEVELVIKGEMGKGAVQFYFFTNTLSENGYTTIRYWLDSGYRYVVFLREDGGVLRTMVDVGEMELRVRSGNPGSIHLPADSGMAVASVLLTPGRDYEAGFPTNIGHTLAVIEPLAPPAYLVSLLRALLAHPNRGVREQACLALSRTYPYRDACLNELLGSIDEPVRRQAADMVASQRRNEPQLLRALEEDPVSLSVSGNVKDLAGDLGLFSLDHDLEVRTLACRALTRLFPRTSPGNCHAGNE